jgi:hypothetical protein
VAAESRRPDITRQDSTTRGSGGPIENERTAMVRICRSGLRHPFLPRRRWQAAGLIARRRRLDYPRQLRRHADGRNVRFFWEADIREIVNVG